MKWKISDRVKFYYKTTDANSWTINRLLFMSRTIRSFRKTDCSNPFNIPPEYHQFELIGDIKRFLFVWKSVWEKQYPTQFRLIGRNFDIPLLDRPLRDIDDTPVTGIDQLTADLGILHVRLKDSNDAEEINSIKNRISEIESIIKSKK